MTLALRCPRAYHRLLAAAALAGASACAPYRADPRLARDLARVSPQMTLRVTRTDGTRVELVQATLVRDSLVGRSAARGARVAVARGEIRAVERRRFSVERALIGYWIYVGVGCLVYIATDFF